MNDNEHWKSEYEKHGGAPIVHDTPDEGLTFKEAVIIFSVILAIFAAASIVMIGVFA